MYVELVALKVGADNVVKDGFCITSSSLTVVTSGVFNDGRLTFEMTEIDWQLDKTGIDRNVRSALFEMDNVPLVARLGNNTKAIISF